MSAYSDKSTGNRTPREAQPTGGLSKSLWPFSPLSRTHPARTVELECRHGQPNPSKREA
jgi:hypothetical protein